MCAGNEVSSKKWGLRKIKFFVKKRYYFLSYDIIQCMI